VVKLKTLFEVRVEPHRRGPSQHWGGPFSMACSTGNGVPQRCSIPGHTTDTTKPTLGGISEH
jgi:hypothetical protein